ncbi:MAG: HD domain-containing phosphohydrolase [Pseudomonadota bacterium]
MNEKILVVDDDKAIARLIGQIAEMGGYACCLAHNGDDAREHLRKDTFHLVLCDVNMPGESGMDLARYIASDYPDTAVVMVSAMDDAEIANTALDMGAYGYVIKPFKPNELAINIANAIRRRELEIESRQHRGNLEKMVQERTEALQHSLSNLRKSLEGTIHAMAMTVESRDPYTAGHQRRVADLAVAIVGEMGINSDRVEGIRMAGVIHDLGKISVPSEILSKPGKINEYEFGLIKNHPQVGYDILKEIDFPWPIAEIVYQHHERMNGSGYPRGRAGDEILKEARIIGVADVVEAMASHRPYRPALGIDAALEEISKKNGEIYDPEVVDACLRLFNEKGYQLS